MSSAFRIRPVAAPATSGGGAITVSSQRRPISAPRRRHRCGARLLLVAVTLFGGIGDHRDGAGCGRGRVGIGRQRRRGPAAAYFQAISSPPGCREIEPYVKPVTLVAGKLGFYGTSGDNSSATLARFRAQRALGLDVDAEALYVSDTQNHVVRVVDLRPAENGGGLIFTALGALGEAGAADGAGAAEGARLRSPSGLAVDGVRRRLYVADEGNHRILRLDLPDAPEPNASFPDLASLPLAHVAGRPVGADGGDDGDGGPGAAAALRSPTGLALDSEGHVLYFSDAGNRRIRAVDLDSGVISAVQVSGGLDLVRPTGLALDAAASLLYVADYSNHVVIKVDLAHNGSSTVIAGVPGLAGRLGDGGTDFRGNHGPALEAFLKHPYGLALDPVAQRLYIADSANPAVRVLDLGSGLMNVAVYRPGYFGFGISDDDLGPVGLALNLTSYVPGLEVKWIIHANMDPPPWTTEGEYFHFVGDSIPDLVPPGTNSSPELPGKELPPSVLRYVRQFRRGVVVWMGQVRFWGERTLLIGPDFGNPCPECTATGVREPPGICVPAPCPGADFVWEIGDVVQILGLAPDFAPETVLHTEEATQLLYMAEGFNHAVRVTNIAPPSDHTCSPLFDDTWLYKDGIPTGPR